MHKMSVVMYFIRILTVFSYACNGNEMLQQNAVSATGNVITYYELLFMHFCLLIS